jgi:hypothetical protein
MAQRLITIAINFEDGKDSSVASNLAQAFSSETNDIKEAVGAIVALIDAVDGVSVSHWSCPITEQWISQEDQISRLYQAIDDHQCACCHQIAAAPSNVEGFEPGSCPPAHNCAVCADIII